MSYNGWKNYETWAVNLHLDNDEGTRQELTAAAIMLIKDEVEYPVADLADMIKNFVEDLHDPDFPNLPPLYQDLLGAAISDVDFRTIAKHYIQSANEDIAAETVFNNQQRSED